MIELARSTYYYKPQSNPAKQAQDAGLKAKIERIIHDLPGSGYRMVTKQLKKEGCVVNHKRVLRIMREHCLLCPIRRRDFISTTDSNHGYTRYLNLAKNFKPQSMNQLWVADITYIRISTGFVYLAIILDVYSRRVIGYSLSLKLNSGLALRALEMAIRDRQPSSGCIHHSDQGIQYASTEYTQRLNNHRFRISMARKGNPYDNAFAERFIRTLKYEEVYLQGYRTVQDVIQKVPFFIQEVYNKKRLHSAIGYLSPAEFEAKMINNTQILSINSV